MKAILLLIVLLGFSTNSYSSFFIEPYVGMVQGDSDDGDNDNSDDFDIGGFGFGARLGMNYAGIIFGGVYDYSSPEGENVGNSSITVDYTFTNAGVFLGYEFSWVKIWYSYYLSSKLELSNTQGSTILAAAFDGLEYSGKGWSFGLGITALPYINLFAELHKYTYDETQRNGTSFNLGADAESAYWLLGISIPFEFGN